MSRCYCPSAEVQHLTVCVLLTDYKYHLCCVCVNLKLQQRCWNKCRLILEIEGIHTFPYGFYGHMPHLYHFYAFSCLNIGVECRRVWIKISKMLVPVKTLIGDKECWQLSQKYPFLCFHGCVGLLISL